MILRHMDWNVSIAVRTYSTVAPNVHIYGAHARRFLAKCSICSQNPEDVACFSHTNLVTERCTFESHRRGFERDRPRKGIVRWDNSILILKYGHEKENAGHGCRSNIRISGTLQPASNVQYTVVQPRGCADGKARRCISCGRTHACSFLLANKVPSS